MDDKLLGIVLGGWRKYPLADEPTDLLLAAFESEESLLAQLSDVDRRRVPVEHHAKTVRNLPGLRDQPAVIRLARSVPGDSCTTCICMTPSGLCEFAILPVIAR
jgi:hypothetical protein